VNKTKPEIFGGDRDGPFVPIYITAVTDDQYAQHLGVAFASLLMNNKKCAPHFFVVTDRLQTENEDKLRGVVTDFGASVSFLSVAGLAKEQFGENIRHPAYLRILIPHLLPSSLEKVLYMDGDVIVEGDLLDLWNTNIDAYHLAAVPDTSRVDHLKKLIGREGLPYFNSGVMLMNLRKWRETHVREALVDFVKRHHKKFLYHDQDALNAVLHGEWLPLDVKYNFQTPLCFADDVFHPEGSCPAAIIHYTGRGKPWDYITVQPFRENYYKYLRLTPWNDYRPKITSQKMINVLGLTFKKYFPSWHGKVRTWLIKRAMSGSAVFRWVCKSLYIELSLNADQRIEK